MAFTVPVDFSTPACIALKSAMMDTIMDKLFDVSLDFSEVESIDTSGIRFVENVQKLLEKNNHKLILFSAKNGTLETLHSSGVDKLCRVFSSLEDFEQTFHEMTDERREGYFKLSNGKGPLHRLALICPLCGTDSIHCFLLDESLHECLWEEDEITPQWHLKEGRANELPFDLYEVSVCHQCFFASARTDHFTLHVPEGDIQSILTHDQLERLIRNNSVREALVSEGYKASAKSFFGIPRAQQSAFIAWSLYDRCLRDASKERLNVDALEVARANLMMAKFSEKGTALDKFFSTAHVWLTDIIKQPERYATKRLVSAFVYLISVDLALDKSSEARKMYQKLIERFKEDERFDIWLERAQSLMDDLED